MLVAQSHQLQQPTTCLQQEDMARATISSAPLTCLHVQRFGGQDPLAERNVGTLNQSCPTTPCPSLREVGVGGYAGTVCTHWNRRLSHESDFQVELVAKAVGEIADQGNVSDLPAADVTWQFEMPLLIRHLVDDLRTFYHEAVAAQPGDNVPNHEALNDWIFGGTALGDAIQAIAQHLTRAGDVGSLMTRGFLVPEGYLEGGGSAFPTPAEVKKTQRP